MRNRKIASIGIWIMALSFAFGIIETVYFGCNWMPNSKQELICDKVSIIANSIGCFLLFYALIKQVIKDINKIFE